MLKKEDCRNWGWKEGWGRGTRLKNCLQVVYPGQKYGEECFPPPQNKSVPSPFPPNCNFFKEKQQDLKDKEQISNCGIKIWIQLIHVILKPKKKSELEITKKKFNNK